MIKKIRTAPKGFTLVELMIAATIMVIVACAIGVVIADTQRGWNIMYGRIYSDVVTDGYVARKMFDAIIRKASREKILIGEAGSWLEVYLYADVSSTVADRYVRLYAADGDLNLENGQLDPRATLAVETVCGNVAGCTFKQAGMSVQMILTLDNGTQKNTIVSSAVTHNE